MRAVFGFVPLTPICCYSWSTLDLFRVLRCPTIYLVCSVSLLLGSRFVYLLICLCCLPPVPFPRFPGQSPCDCTIFIIILRSFCAFPSSSFKKEGHWMGALRIWVDFCYFSCCYEAFPVLLPVSSVVWGVFEAFNVCLSLFVFSFDCPCCPLQFIFDIGIDGFALFSSRRRAT